MPPVKRRYRAHWYTSLLAPSSASYVSFNGAVAPHAVNASSSSSMCTYALGKGQYSGETMRWKSTMCSTYFSRS
jgi:hypothetical protein